MKNYELSTDNNLLEYIEDFEKAGYVSTFIGSKTDFILGKPHHKLFCSLPENAFSKSKLTKKVFRKFWSPKKHIEYRKLDYIIRYYVYINNVFDYINQILIDIAVRQCYGESAAKDPYFLDSIFSLFESEVSFGEKAILSLLKFSVFNRKSKSDRARDFLRDFVLKGRLKKMSKKTIGDNYSLVNIILKNQVKINISDDIFYTALPDYLILFVTLLGDKLPNFLIDISLDPTVFKKLEIEQKKIMAKYGKRITISCLNEMVYLDAAILESIRLGITMKESQCDFFLPNGVFVPKGSFVKFNNITHNRTSPAFKMQPHNYIPERHFKIGTKLGVISENNLMWGLGKGCPYRKYCEYFLKLFASTLIRNYKISQGENA
ncbi:hypothetical protein BB560_004560 [Smittium megazygosporum]|uniref:Cytochrome P450 n=1 Tax=Smittium megazygosporum TaxID=133381 RepID=A0A2T9Z933_9FUNG|nr:hypothetical protein BB560_004560 [Smittium megazygosporum]